MKTQAFWKVFLLIICGMLATSNSYADVVFDSRGVGDVCTTSGLSQTCNGVNLGRNYLSERFFHTAPANTAVASAFTVPSGQSYDLDLIELPLYLLTGTTNFVPYDVYLKKAGADGLPGETIYLTTVLSPVDRITAGVQPKTIALSLLGAPQAPKVKLVGGQKYWLVLAITVPTANLTSAMTWNFNLSQQPIAGTVASRVLDSNTGDIDSGTPWAISSSQLPAFKIYGTPYPSPLLDQQPLPNIGSAQFYVAGDFNPIIKKRHAVVITHGWNSDTVAWPQQMAAAIRNIIERRHIPNETWDVYYVDWSADAHTLLPNTAYANAGVLGKKLADQLEPLNYDDFHFIAHSAGSNLIETAARELVTKALKNNTSRPIIHSTFLDAYDPAGATSSYGFSAQWAEQYVDKRNKLGLLSNTNITLPSAYNFNITALDPDQTYLSLPNCILFSGNLTLCNIDRVQSFHSWPYRWYQESVDQFTVPALANPPPAWIYGFPLATEYRDIGLPQHSTLVRGLECALLNSSTLCGVSSIASYADTRSIPVSNPFINPTSTSSTGTVLVSPLSLSLTTGSPVWVSFEAQVPESFNALQFNYHFNSQAEGLLSVFLDDTVVYKADERQAGAAVNDSGLISLGVVAPGVHTLSFRLDPYSATQSSVEITNIATLQTSIVRVTNEKPIADAGLNQTVRVGSLVHLDGSASSDPDQKPLALSYTWNQSAGSETLLFGANSVNPNFTPQSPGAYSFALSVNDGASDSDVTTVTVDAFSLGDVNGDGQVNMLDLELIRGAINSSASGPNDLRDLNGDGRIDNLDIAQLRTICGAVCNQAPIANAGVNRTVEAISSSGASVTLDGTASTDPDGDALTYNWTGAFGTTSVASPTVALPLGVNLVTLTVNDGLGGTSSATVTVSIIDTKSPVITCPSNVTGTFGSPVQLGFAAATDLVTLNPIITNNAPSTFPLGLTTVTWTAKDTSGNTASCTQTVNMASLYTFNGFFRSVRNPPYVNILGVSDSVALKFSLGGNRGLGILAAGTPTVSPISCPAGPLNTAKDIDTRKNGLFYNTAAGIYSYIWRPSLALKGTCQKFTLKLNDGSEHSLFFKITK